jgi:hypothetical protein
LEADEVTPDPTPPPASLWIEEQIALCEREIEICEQYKKTAPRARREQKIWKEVIATLRRVPALERLHALCKKAGRHQLAGQWMATLAPEEFDKMMGEMET